jgi:AAA domain
MTALIASTALSPPNWSPQQAAALRQIEEWASAPDSKQVFQLIGYAGTGKSTLAKYAAEIAPGGAPAFLAYTAKAAHVMRRKGCLGAGTIGSNDLSISALGAFAALQ